MRLTGQLIPMMSSSELDCIHQGAMRLLREMGMEIQNRRLLTVLADFGLPVDFDRQRVRFPTPVVESYLAEAERFDWERAEAWVGGSAGVYHGRYHDPESGALVEWSEEALAYYFALAKSLPILTGAQMLGCRLPAPAALEPLYERYYCWKYGAEEGSSIYLDETCPYLFDLYQARADQLGQPIQDVFHGTVYLIPALRLGQHEAYQVDYFRERGLRVGIGDMYALGANAPVTLAGAVTLNLAEQLALGILNWAWFGDKKLRLGGSLSVMDMRTMIYPYGRPEMALANLMLAQIARHYGAAYTGHAGLSDAKLPSAEAGYQKALTGIPTLMAGGGLWMDAGLLSIDEICSPVQLILDHEFLSALQHLIKPFTVDAESIGLETILAAGPAGQYLDKDHTVRYLRSELWQPTLWSREMLTPWLDGPRKLDADKARDKALAFKSEFQSRPLQPLPDAFEQEFQRIIRRAGQEPAR
jgi:trimethylamine--corrinoid protein Co-methyltransferase